MPDAYCLLLADRPSPSPPYRALALQVAGEPVGAADRVEARDRIARNIARVGAQVRASKAFIGDDLKLVVLPEQFATAAPPVDAPAAWYERTAFAGDGAEYAALAAIAQANGVYLASNAWEADAALPGLHFQACVIFDDCGRHVLRYRRLMTLSAPSPHDVWNRYLDVHGLEGVFPVARTPLGNLACLASEDVLYPEIARALALRGAEVFLHATGGAGNPQRAATDMAVRARAFENMAFLVSAATGGAGADLPPGPGACGTSTVVDDQGRVMAVAGGGESMIAHGEIGIHALRRRRARPGMGHTLSRLPQAAIRAGLLPAPLRANALLDAGTPRPPAPGESARRQHAVIQHLKDTGVLGD